MWWLQAQQEWTDQEYAGCQEKAQEAVQRKKTWLLLLLLRLLQKRWAGFPAPGVEEPRLEKELAMKLETDEDERKLESCCPGRRDLENQQSHPGTH